MHWARINEGDLMRAEATRSGNEIAIRLLVREGDPNWNIMDVVTERVRLGKLAPGSYRITVNDWSPVTLTLAP